VSRRLLSSRRNLDGEDGEMDEEEDSWEPQDSWRFV